MEYVLGAIAGLIFGAVVAFLKARFLWKGRLETDDPTQIGGVMAASALSFFINVAALAVVFLLRGVLPFSWIACLLALGLAMSILNPYFISRYKPREADGPQA